MDFLFGDKPLMEKVFKDMQPSLARLVLEWSFTFPLSPSDCLNEIAIFFARILANRPLAVDPSAYKSP